MLIAMIFYREEPTPTPFKYVELPRWPAKPTLTSP
tara:strand:+ start:1313 stop:1417 length:105 start_codon:yes stop_codon:yes gene_type:complete